MAEIIDIRQRLRRSSGAGNAKDCGPLRVRLLGPDMHWVGLLAALLAEALAQQGYAAAFEYLPEAEFSALDLVTGGAAEPVPALLVSGIDLQAELLQGCDAGTLLLAHGHGEGRRPFAGRLVTLPFPCGVLTSLDLAVVCTAGAARLLGVVGWGALEQALRRELSVALPFEDFLILAFETYHRLAAWEGSVWTRPDEIC
jgi:hypothetical protein